MENVQGFQVMGSRPQTEACLFLLTPEGEQCSQRPFVGRYVRAAQIHQHDQGDFLCSLSPEQELRCRTVIG